MSVYLYSTSCICVSKRFLGDLAYKQIYRCEPGCEAFAGVGFVHGMSELPLTPQDLYHLADANRIFVATQLFQDLVRAPGVLGSSPRPATMVSAAEEVGAAAEGTVVAPADVSATASGDSIVVEEEDDDARVAIELLEALDAHALSIEGSAVQSSIENTLLPEDL